MLLKPTPLIYRKRPGKPRRVTTPPVSLAPVMIAASFTVGEENLLTITFDRAVNTDAVYDMTKFVVFDAVHSTKWDSNLGFFQETADTVVFEMDSAGAFAGTGVTLTVAADNGIVGEDNDVAWAGCTGVVLPFPS